MLHEDKKIALISNELMSIMLSKGAKDIEVKIKRDTEATRIHFIYRNCPFDESLINEIRHHLNMPRRPEVESYYWQLIGDNETYDELHLVGAMLDESEVTVRDGALHIHVVRRGNESSSRS